MLRMAEQISSIRTSQFIVIQLKEIEIKSVLPMKYTNLLSAALSNDKRLSSPNGRCS